MDKIKLRQICFLFAAVMPVTKMIIYPATVSYYAKNDLLLSAALNLLLMGAVLSPDEIIAAYDAVTREDVRTLARELFRFENASLSAVGRGGSAEGYQALLS